MTTRYRLALVDAGLDWIGPVPAQWQVRRLGHYFEERRVKVSDKDFAPLSVTMKGVVPQLENVAKTDDGDNRKLVRSGDFVINSRSDRKGSGGIAPRDGSVSLINTVLATQAGMRSQFASYLLTSYPFQEEFYRVGNGIVADMWTTKYGEMKNIRLAVPSLPEQDAIVAYLDRTTTRIDTLVAKKARFIELLREKRQALITHAVTKGLDPNVPMKDSGVEWLGKVPADWKVVSLKRIGRLKGGSVFPPNLQGRPENDLPFFKVGDLGKSPDGQHLGDTENTITHGEAKELGATVFPADALVWAKIGAALSLNRRRITTRPSCLDNNMTGFVPDTTLVSTRYCFYLMSSVDFTVHAKPGAVPSFSEGDQGELHISLPPKKLQNAIVIHLDRATSRIDTLIAKTERSIELLREHRTALITAAVTGKLDLRPAA